jgi:hypothetical protein
MTSHRCLRTAGSTLLVALAFASPAFAAPAVTGATAAPADVKAGAHSDFTVDFKIEGLGAASGGDDLKSLRLDLPPGLVGNPLATGATCPKEQLTADACPAGTRVGTTTTVADVNVLLLPLSDQSIPGDIYNIPTTGAEAARLGIVLRPAAGLFPKVILESPVFLRSPGDGGLTSTVDGIPKTAATASGDADLLIKRMTLTLLGKLGSGKAFMTNPTSCAAAPTTITIGTYAGATAAATAAFTPTACDALPFAPKLAAKIGTTRDDARPGAQPAIAVTVTQADGEANAKSVAVTLPAGFSSSIEALGNACAAATYDAGGCPAAAVIGSASAESPLLAAPLSGPVTLVADPVGGLPQLRVALRGAFPVNLVGMVSIAPNGGLVNTFGGIYDVPLSRFVLTLAAGTTNPVKVSRDLCLPGQGTLAGAFVAHSGTQATATANAELAGCEVVRKPTLSGKLRKRTLTLTATSRDRPLRSLGFRLPKGLHFTARAAKRAKVTTSPFGVGAKVSVSTGRLAVKLAGDGASRVTLVLRRGALRVARKPTRRLRVDVGVIGAAVARSTVELR